MKWYTVRDNINGEILQFSKRIDAEYEVERRLTRHRSGYNFKRNIVAGCNAVVIKNDHTFIITNGDNLWQKKCLWL